MQFGNYAQQAWRVEVECMRLYSPPAVSIPCRPSRIIFTVRLGLKSNKPPPSRDYFKPDWREFVNARTMVCERTKDRCKVVEKDRNCETASFKGERRSFLFTHWVEMWERWWPEMGLWRRLVIGCERKNKVEPHQLSMTSSLGSTYIRWIDDPLFSHLPWTR